MRNGLLLVIALAILTAPVALAQERPVFWFGVSGGYGTYAMSDVNDVIQDFNQAYDINMDEISSGLAFGVQAGVQLTPAVTIFGGYERLTGSSELGGSGYRFEFRLPANALMAGAQYTFDFAPTFRFGFAGAVGMISAAGEYELAFAGVGTESCSLTGSGVLLQGQAVADFAAADRVILSPSVGYRMAEIGEFEECGEIAYLPDGSQASLDYSGIILRATVKLILN